MYRKMSSLHSVLIVKYHYSLYKDLHSSICYCCYIYANINIHRLIIVCLERPIRPNTFFFFAELLTLQKCLESKVFSLYLRFKLFLSFSLYDSSLNLSSLSRYYPFHLIHPIFQYNSPLCVKLPLETLCLHSGYCRQYRSDFCRVSFK